MMSLDWLDLWTRLRRMLWAAGVLGAAGVAVGLWVYGVTLASWYEGMPGAFADVVRPNALQDVVRIVFGWLDGWEGPVMLAWIAAVVWLYLVPEICGGRQAWATVLGTAGMIAAALVDTVGPHWGEDDQFVRCGILLGVGTYMGIGLAVGERRGRLARRLLEGAVTGGVIGLLSAYGTEVSRLTLVPSVAPETQLLIAPVFWGVVVGWTVTGGRECLGGPEDLATALRRRWPLVLGVTLVLVNTVGPVVWLQAIYTAR